MSDRYEAQVAAALGAVAVRAPAAYLWFGRRVAVAPGESLVAAIGQRLLADFHPSGTPRPAPRARLPVASAERAAFGRALSQANCGRGPWQAGWRVAGAEQDALAVVRPDGLALLAAPEDCRVDGALAAVRIPKDAAGHLPGVLRVLGDAAAAPGDEDLVRLCWNVSSAGAVTLVARVTYVLNRANLPFTLDVLTEPARYGDGASADLLLARSDFAAAIGLLRPLLRALGPHLCDGAPAFTKPLARGLALAEEPAGEQRFAEHRCALLAEAIVAASERGLATPAARIAALREHFGAAGISLDRPYLQAGSTDAYDRS